MVLRSSQCGKVSVCMSDPGIASCFSVGTDPSHVQMFVVRNGGADSRGQADLSTLEGFTFCRDGY